jgi:hypothetical protein
MERKASLILLAAALFGAALAGCEPTEATATQEEEARFRDPIMEPPAEAGNMGGPAGAPEGAAPPPPPPAGAQAGPG